jgi:hypothetical protein
MFKIMLNALWSRDYVTQLAQVLSACIPCEMDEAYLRIRDLGEGKGMTLISSTVGKAEALACDFLQYGCYIEVEQIAAMSDEMMLEDLKDWFDDDQRFFSVLYDNDGHVSKIIEERGYGYLRLESQAVSDWVGAELIRNGAKRLERADWPALKERLDKAVADNEVRRAYIRAQRSEEKRRRLERGESVEGMDFDFEEE